MDSGSARNDSVGRAHRQSIAVIASAAFAVAGCTATASYDDTLKIPAPSFAPAPAKPADSPQLDALILRDTSGLDATGPLPDASLVTAALAAVEEQFPGTDRVSDLYFDEGGVWMTMLDPDATGRERSIYWSDSRLWVGEAEFMEEDETFPIADLHVEAIAALLEGLAERYPTLALDTPRLSTQLSYELGLSWRVDLVDARGTLATIFADLDGTVTVVDQS